MLTCLQSSFVFSSRPLLARRGLTNRVQRGQRRLQYVARGHSHSISGWHVQERFRQFIHQHHFRVTISCDVRRHIQILRHFRAAILRDTSFIHTSRVRVSVGPFVPAVCVHLDHIPT